jgi:hypothetical protein
MPRQQTLQIEGRPLLDTQGPKVGTQVVASPVDTFEDQGMGQKMSRLNNLLESGKDLLAAYDASETKQGAQDRALGMPKKETVLGSYEQGWLGLDGAIKGQQDAEKVRTSFASAFDRSAPGGLEKWLQDRQGELMQGMKPGPFAAAYRVKLAEGFQSLREQHATEQREAVTAQAEGNVITLLTGAARGKSNKGEAVTVDDFLGVRQALADSGLGMDDTRMDKLGHSALKVLAGEGDVQAIRAAMQANKDGVRAFPTLGDDALYALENHAINVKLDKHEAAEKAIKLEHEHKVSDTMFPIIQMAQAGSTSEAQKAFDRVVSSNLFAHEPKSIEMWQRLIVSTGDKSDSFEQVERLNQVTMNILTKGWGLKEIQASGLTPKLMRDAFVMFDHKRREERQAASEARAAARQEASAARFSQALEKSHSITVGADFKPTIKAVLEALPAMPESRRMIDQTTGSRRLSAVKAIKADTEKELIRTAVARGSDLEGWRKDIVRIRDNATERTRQVIDTQQPGNIRPAFIRHGTWDAYKKAAQAGEYGDDLAELDEARQWFETQAERASHR